MRVRIPLLVAMTALLVQPAAADAAFPGNPGNPGRIAYDSDRDDPNRELYETFPGALTTIRDSMDANADTRPAYNVDGTVIAFQTNRNGNLDIYAVNSGGSIFTTGQVTSNAASDVEPAYSPQPPNLGGVIVFATNRDGNFELYSTAAGGTRLTNTSGDEREPAWSPDGTQIAFTRDGDIHVMPAAGGAATNLTNSPLSNEGNPNWAPDGTKIAFDSDAGGDLELYSMNADGSGVVPLTSNLVDDRQPAWAPDGTRIAFERAGDILTIAAAGGDETVAIGEASSEANPDWQPLVGYPRARGASPLRVPFVPAFAPCSSPNRTHGPSLAFPSCSPPVPGSPIATVGYPDSGLDGGSPVQSVGFLRLSVLVGVPAPPDDSDVRVRLEIPDVRCRPAAPAALCSSANSSGGADYTGQMRLSLPTRITDRFSAVPPGGGVDRATVSDFDFAITAVCQATVETSLGGRCRINTSFLAVVPGSVKDAKRDMRQLGQIRVFDAGPDGDATTTSDNSPFAVQGVFVP